MKDHQEQQIRNLSLALQEREIEIKGLKQALKVMHLSNKQKTSLYPDLADQLTKVQEELMATQLQLEQQMEHAVGLQYQILRQQEELRTFKDQQQRFIRRIVELEIDLETHDVHFSETAQETKNMEATAMQQALHWTNENVPHSTTKGQDQKQSFDLIAKLTSDYAQLEARYKRDAADNLHKSKRLEQENQTLKASLAVLEERLNSHNKKTVKFTLNESNNVNIFRRRINDLEVYNAKLVLQQKEMNKRLEQLQSSGMDAKTTTTGSLQSNFNGHKGKHRSEVASVAKLQQELDRTRQQIALLRMRAINYQIRNFFAPNDKIITTESADKNSWQSHSPYSSSDGESYRGSSSDDDDDLSGGLQTTIRDLKELLVRKNIELHLQQSHFQTREMELLAQLQGFYAASIDTHYNVSSHFFL